MGILRTLLALSVVFFHTSHSDLLVGGRTAVQLFYIISGFLISYVLTDTPSYKSARVFWLNRALRLYPVYLFVLLLMLVAHIFDPTRLKEFSSLPGVAQFVVVVVNTIIIGQDWTLFTSIQNGTLELTGRFWDSGPFQWPIIIVPQAWTLGLELTFYAIAPFIVRRPLVLIFLFVASAGARAYAIYAGFGLSYPWTYAFFPFELSLFILGVASHQLLLEPVSALVAKFQNLGIERIVTFFCIAACTVYFIVPLNESEKLPLLIAIVALSLPFLFIFQDNSRIDQWIGDLSYPLYIGHWLVISILAYLLRKQGWQGNFIADLFMASCAILFAVVLKVLIADPVEKIRRAVKSGRRPFDIKLFQRMPVFPTL